jgi:hypothetical protein
VGPIPFDNLHCATTKDKQIVFKLPVHLSEILEVHPVRPELIR